jgi:hypothetical protein
MRELDRLEEEVRQGRKGSKARGEKVEGRLALVGFFHKPQS